MTEKYRAKRQENIIKKSMQIPYSGCWIWTGGTINNGYGQSFSEGKKCLAHRLSYTIFEGEIPSGLTIDHLCKNILCVNPNHLQPVSMRENVMRSNSVCSLNSKKTHCSRGHEYSIENTYIYKNGWRQCKECWKIRALEQYYKNKNK